MALILFKSDPRLTDDSVTNITLKLIEDVNIGSSAFEVVSGWFTYCYHSTKS